MGHAPLALDRLPRQPRHPGGGTHWCVDLVRRQQPEAILAGPHSASASTQALCIQQVLP